MKKTIYPLLLLTTLTFCACQETDMALTGQRLRTVHATVSDNTTRVSLAENTETQDMIASWQPDDRIYVILGQGTTYYDIGSVPLDEITADGKSCVYQYALPDEVNAANSDGYELMCFTTNCNAKVVDGDVYYNASLLRAPLSQFRDRVMFDSQVTEANHFATFQRYGTYEILHLTNTSDKDITFSLSDYDASPRWYKMGGGAIRLWDKEFVTDLSYEPQSVSSPIKIAANETEAVVTWYVPNGQKIDNARMVAEIDGQYVHSSNTLSSSVTLCTGIAYHIYATWDGTELKFGHVVTEPAIEVTPTEIDFGEVEHGTTQKEHFSIYNIGSADLTFKAKKPGAPFSIDYADEEITLAPGHSHMFTVTYDGSLSRDKTATAKVEIESNATNIEGTINVVLSVKGTGGLQGYTACPDDNHPHMIDLGLPSGTLWACCNVGATKPSDSGGFYSWGETEVKTDYSQKAYKYYQDNSYVRLLGYETVPGGTGHWATSIAGKAEYDAATANWDSPWCMPTRADMSELCNYTTSVWTSQNGQVGRLFTGSNGATIFMPACGLYWGGTVVKYSNEVGFYWTSTISDKYGNGPYAYHLYFGESNKSVGFYAGYYYLGISFGDKGTGIEYYDYGAREFGQNVRPVAKD